MRKTLCCAALATAALLTAATARADCDCPQVSLDERIAGATVIFSGRPLMNAQIPAGSSPFHSEQSLEQPGGMQYDLITLFQVDTIWKGKATPRIKIRHERGACGADFEPDVPVIVFAEADDTGIFWTRACNGNATSGDGAYETLKQGLTNRIRYN